MKKLLYFGHAYHKKTRSVGFLQDLLESRYEVHYFASDPTMPDDLSAMAELPVKEFDVLVVFQVMPKISELRKYVKFNRGVFFPMYDYYYSVTPLDNPIWNEYKDFTIINFSSTLHNDVKACGFASHYIQYFPPMPETQQQGKTDSMYFWQRLTDINIYLLHRLLNGYPLKHLHIHKAIDPNERFIPISDDPNDACSVYFKKLEVTESVWYETREEMQKDIAASALYVAPRFHEGIGLSFLEAMAMGRCVIAVNNPTMNEYIIDGENGFLYDISSPAPIALSPEKIRNIQQNTIKYMQEGRNRWEKDKSLILDWLEQKPSANKKLLKRTSKERGWQQTIYKESWKRRLKNMVKPWCPSFIWEIMRKGWNSFTGRFVPWQTTEFHLFALIPILQIKRALDSNRIRIQLFGIPVYEYSAFDNRTSGKKDRE